MALQRPEIQILGDFIREIFDHESLVEGHSEREVIDAVENALNSIGLGDTWRRFRDVFDSDTTYFINEDGTGLISKHPDRA